MVEIQSVEFEHYREAFGIGTGNPRISWRFQGTAKNWTQSSYEIEVLRGPGDSTPILFNSKSTESVLVPWPSTELVSRESAQVRVRATGSAEAGTLVTSWSKPVIVEAGLINEDWRAAMIAAPRTVNPSGSLRPALFRRSFELTKPVRSARLYITSLGVYEAQINGRHVSDQVLAPGWTSYTHRLNYQTFDVRDLLHNGENVIAAEVAEGWYSGRLGWNGGARSIYGDQLALFAQLEIFCEGGEELVIATDKKWKTSVGPRLSAELYDGEVYDASLQRQGWSAASFDAKDWVAVEELPFRDSILVSSEAPPTRLTETVKPRKISRSPSGKVLVDFGQNLVGWVRVRVSGPRGTTITFTHTEVLEFGEAATRPLRDAKATDTITLSGTDIEWEPKFTFHGFRYVQVDGWPSSTGKPGLADIEARVIHTDMKQTGWFECSDPLINQLHSNIRWGMRGNFVSIPTDCPQRDERLGWTGDIQIFTPTANFLYDTAGTLSGWLKDVALEQIEDNYGVTPLVVPNILQYLSSGFDQAQAVWGDVVVLTPWDLYQSFGDIKFLEDQYESMTSWLDRGIPRGANGLWTKDTSPLGDWLDPDAPPDNPGAAKTNGHLVADAYLVHITSIVAKIGEILGHDIDADCYRGEVSRLAELWQETYINPKTHRLLSDTMTSLSLALSFSLLPSSQISAAAERLAQTAIASKFHISTGFVGTPLICPALTSQNLTPFAYRMLQTKTCPSWLYPVTMGATTMWERWDSMLPDGTINPGSMTSFNHYALGSVGAWLHATVGGIRAAEPGWKTIRFEPIPGGTITSAKTRFEGPYGRVECEWEIRDHGELGGWDIIDAGSPGSSRRSSFEDVSSDAAQRFLHVSGDKDASAETKVRKELKFSMRALVPPNSRAEIKLPGLEEIILVGSGTHEFAVDYVAPKEYSG